MEKFTNDYDVYRELKKEKDRINSFVSLRTENTYTCSDSLHKSLVETYNSMYQFDNDAPLDNSFNIKNDPLVSSYINAIADEQHSSIDPQESIPKTNRNVFNRIYDFCKSVIYSLKIHKI